MHVKFKLCNYETLVTNNSIELTLLEKVDGDDINPGYSLFVARVGSLDDIQIQQPNQTIKTPSQTIQRNKFPHEPILEVVGWKYKIDI